MTLLKWIGMAACAAVMGAVLRGLGRRDMAVVLETACGVLLGQMLEAAKSALDVLPAFAQQSGVDAELTKFLLRVTGIALICELAAQLCRDAGSGGLAQKVELGGKVVILCACLPLVRELSACALSLLD